MKSFFGTYNSAELRSATHAAAMKETRGGDHAGRISPGQPRQKKTQADEIFEKM
jgi:hypothetical protein